MKVAAFDALDVAEAAALLRSCCGATRWVGEMLARRPFRTLANVLTAADDVWWSLDTDDWLEAFQHHPRIGESHSAVAQGDRARDWSAKEQSGMSEAAEATRRQLTEANIEYEERFGHICIICAAGRTANELLAVTEARLLNAPEAELRISAEEQRKITRLRLEKLFHDEPGAVGR